MKINLLFLTTVMLLNTMAVAQWSDDATQNFRVTDLAGEQVIPKTAVCANGDFYVGFLSSEDENYNVRLQRFDSQGNPQWASNGILISDHESMSWVTDWDLTVDQDHHAILTWQDIREGGNNNTVAYRISPDGEFVWGENGIMLSSSTSFDVAPKVTVTNSNNAVFAWQSDSVIIMQKITPDGEKQWGEWGITLSSDLSYSWPQLLPAGDDGVIMKFFEDSGPTWAPTRHILAQKFDGNGTPVWEDYTVVYNEGTIQFWHQILSFVSDGNGGFFLAWHDFTMSPNQSSAWIQHINAEGEPVFQPNGVLLSTRNDFNQFYPSIARPDGDENVYVYWREVNGNQNQWGIFAQKIDPQGQRLWGDQGKVILPVGPEAYFPHFVDKIGNDMLLVYENGSYQLRATRIDSEGEFVWQPAHAEVNNTTAAKGHFDATLLHNNQWLLAWEETRLENTDIYVQNLNSDGTIGISQTELYTLTLEVFPEGAGTAEGGGSYEAGTEITLSATPNPGYVFLNWSESDFEISTEPTFVFTMPAEDVTLEAIFTAEPQIHTVTFNVDVEDISGFFNPEDDVLYITGSMFDWQIPGEATQLQTLTRVGETMTWSITMELQEGDYEYKYFLNGGWTGGEWAGPDNRVISVSSDATFNDIWSAYNIYNLDIQVNPEGAGTIIGDAIYHSNVMVTASAA
ncbi:MAG: InlB B-repeat-containing protein, partial [Bacteroidota bacterium]